MGLRRERPLRPTQKHQHRHESTESNDLKAIWSVVVLQGICLAPIALLQGLMQPAPRHRARVKYPNA
jgi:hypothetical protein